MKSQCRTRLPARNASPRATGSTSSRSVGHSPMAATTKMTTATSARSLPTMFPAASPRMMLPPIEERSTHLVCGPLFLPFPGKSVASLPHLKPGSDYPATPAIGRSGTRHSVAVSSRLYTKSNRLPAVGAACGRRAHFLERGRGKRPSVHASPRAALSNARYEDLFNLLLIMKWLPTHSGEAPYGLINNSIARQTL